MTLLYYFIVSFLLIVSESQKDCFSICYKRIFKFIKKSKKKNFNQEKLVEELLKDF